MTIAFSTEADLIKLILMDWWVAQKAVRIVDGSVLSRPIRDNLKRGSLPTNLGHHGNTSGFPTFPAPDCPTLSVGVRGDWQVAGSWLQSRKLPLWPAAN